MHSSGDGALELSEPYPAFFEWGLAPEGNGSRVAIRFVAYGLGEEAVTAERARWSSALERLVPEARG
jgi:hypothetical protein